MTGAFSPEGGEPELPKFDEAVGELDDAVLLALNGFDSARNSLHDAVARAAAELPELVVYKEECSVFGSQATTALGRYVSAALEVQEREAVKTDFLELWRQDDQERTAIFLGIFEGDGCFEPYLPESLQDMADDIFAEENPNEELPKIVSHVYGSLLGDELSEFAAHLEKLRAAKQEEEAEVRYRSEHSLSHLAANHVLDVAKIAAGTAIALWVHKKISVRGW